MEEELDLASQLKEEHCYASGKEKNVKESAKVLYKLGLIYKQKGPDKICLIQAATLLNAAIFRNPDNVDEIQEDLKDLCSYLLKSAGAWYSESDLISHSAVVKSQIYAMREKVQEQLIKLDVIPTNAQEEDLHRLEEKKIHDVQKLQNYIAEEYKSIMNQLSSYCIEVMGEPPCKYTLAGMGSLARKEITPYSDFENVIVLEEGVQNRTDYPQIQKYFRWFAVVFQIILINLQETIIPSVSIPCLNDYTKPKGDWFFDAHTTRGVSFDGMMPHACKSPLGRQQETKDKQWTTELIKPVSEMTEYLEKEEDLKNGYHLADILATTCYVSGDKSLYNNFKAIAQEKLTNHDEELKNQLEKQIIEDLQNFSTEQNLSSLNLRFNIKRVVYRSTTIFISGLGKMYKIDASSCFDIVSRLGEMGLISSEFEHKLKYAVALACEIRLRVYMKRKKQDDWVEHVAVKEETGFLVQTAGEKSIYDYFQIAYSLQFDMCSYLGLDMNRFYFNPLSLTINLCYFLKLYDRAILAANLLLENLLSSNNAKHADTPRSCNIGPCFAMLQEQNVKLENYKPQECTTSSELQEHTVTNKNPDMAFSFTSIGHCLIEVYKYEEALDYFQKSLDIYLLLSVNEEIDTNIANSYNNIGTCLRRMNKYSDALKFYKKSLHIYQKVNEEPNNCIADSINNIGRCLFGLNRFNQALHYFEKSLAIYTKNSDENSCKNMAYCCNNIGNCLTNLNRQNEAVEYYQKALNI